MATLARVAGPQATALMIHAGPISLICSQSFLVTWFSPSSAGGVLGMGTPVFMDNLLFYVQWFTIMGTDEGGGDGFDGAGEKDPAGKSNLRVSCDSMNCIRFDGYNLSPAAIAEHPNRNEALLMSSDEKSKFFDRFS